MNNPYGAKEKIAEAQRGSSPSGSFLALDHTGPGTPVDAHQLRYPQHQGHANHGLRSRFLLVAYHIEVE